MPIEAVFFDFMAQELVSTGTEVSPPRSHDHIPSPGFRARTGLATRLFRREQRTHRAGLPVEDIDITHARAFDGVLADKFPALKPSFDDAAKQSAIRAFHDQTAWPDVAPALTRLRELGYEVFVHANGTTRLQLDLLRAAGLYMAAPEAYHKALRSIKARPEDVVKVAAHVSDLRGAKVAGMKTVYTHRWTDDVDEDMQQIRGEFDVFLEGLEGLVQTIQDKFLELSISLIALEITQFLSAIYLPYNSPMSSTQSPFCVQTTTSEHSLPQLSTPRLPPPVCQPLVPRTTPQPAHARPRVPPTHTHAD